MNLEGKIRADLWESTRENYEGKNYSGAISDAFYYLTELIRSKSGIDGDGSALIGQAFGGDKPKIKLNRLQTESDKNIQKGMEQILRGLYLAIRNPRSHDKTIDAEPDAQAIIIFINYISKQLDQARSQFSRHDFINRILDPDFLPTDRYSELLVNDIPAGQRLEVFFDVYRVKQKTKTENLFFFFGVLLKTLNADDMTRVYDAISDELKTAEDDDTIRYNIAPFQSDIWPNLHEVSRLRIENRLLKSISEGRYDSQNQRCRSGALGTWATNIFAHFTLKDEALYNIYSKLNSGNEEEEDYIFKFIFNFIDMLSDTPPTRLSYIFTKKLKEGNIRFYNALEQLDPWEIDAWTTKLKDAYENFVEAEPTNSMDDVPF